MEKNSGFATKQIHTGKIEIPGIAPLATPIFQTSTFEFETTAQGAHRFAGEEAGYIYTRLGNPNTTKIGEKLAALEHAEAGMAMASGMGAVTTVCGPCSMRETICLRMTRFTAALSPSLPMG